MAGSHHTGYSPVESRLKRWLDENGADRTPPASVCSPARWRMFLANMNRKRFSFSEWTKRTSGKWKCDRFTDELDAPRRRGKAGLY